MGLIVLLLEGLALACAVAIAYTAWLLTHPPRRTYATAVSRSRPGDPGELSPRRSFETWMLRSRNLDLPVWDIPGDLAAGPTIILTHGWGDSRIGALARVHALAPVARRIVAWDMAGHGEAQGRCSLGTRETDDLLALIDQVREPASTLVLFGWSLGAGVSIAAAASRAGQIAGVIAEAPYCIPVTPARNVLRRRSLPHAFNLPPALAMIGISAGVGPGFTGFDRAKLAARLACPLLVVHGELDDISPPDDGRRIAEAGRGELLLLPDGGHAGLWTEPRHAQACGEAVARFLSGLR